MTGNWRKLHNEELHNSYSSPRAYSTMEAKRIAYGILVGKPEGIRTLRKPGCRWVNNIKMDLRVIGWDGMDWIYLTRDKDHWRALVNTVMDLRVP
jgi:hypothetical protein